MNLSADSVAFALEDARTAALFFDHVVPFDGREVLEPGLDWGFVNSLIIPPELDSAVTIYQMKSMMNWSVPRMSIADRAKFSSGQGNISKDDYESKQHLSGLNELLSQPALQSCSIFGEDLDDPSGPNTSPALLLSSLDLVDASNISWKHIAELRRDAKATARLRNLRRFVYKEYSGKPMAYIQEDMLFRLEYYAETAKFWGLPTKKGVLEIAMSGEALASIGAGLSLALFGAPLEAAAAAGASIAVGKASLAVAARLREIGMEGRKNPLSYLHNVRQAFAKPQVDA